MIHQCGKASMPAHPMIHGLVLGFHTRSFWKTLIVDQNPYLQIARVNCMGIIRAPDRVLEGKKAKTDYLLVRFTSSSIIVSPVEIKPV